MHHVRKYRIGVLCTAPSIQMASQYEALLGLSEFEFVMMFRHDLEHNGAWTRQLPRGMESIILKPATAWYLPRRVRHLYNVGVKQVLDAYNFDAIILHGYFDHLSLWQAIAWCKKHNRPYLVRTDGNVAKEKGTLRRWWRKIAFGRNLTRAAAMPIMGVQNRKYYELYGANQSQFFMAPWEMDYPQLESALGEAAPHRQALRAQLNLPPQEAVVICVARLLKLKNIEHIIEAVMRVSQEGTAIRLLIAGEGPHRPALEEFIAKTNAPATLCGNLGRADVIRWMVASDVFVLASQFEAWALVVNEACLCGLPLVLSDQVGAAPDLLLPGQNGYMFPAGDVDSLAAHLRTLASDAQLRQRMGQRSRQILSAWRSEHPAAEGYRRALRYALGLDK